MNKTKKIVIGALISVVTLGGLIGCSHPAGGFSGGMTEEKASFIVDRISSKLNLTTVQKQNLVALKDTLKKQKEAHKTNSNPQDTIKALLSTPVLDETKVLAMVEERSKKMSSSAPAIVTAIANFTNSLDNKQREQVKAFVDKMGKRRGGRPFGRGW